MGAGDKIRNKAEKFTGELRRRVGRLTGDRELEIKGQFQKVRASLRQIAERSKDIFRR